MSELIALIMQAVAGGTVPRPAPQEPVEDFQFRCAHAGALVALAWANARAAQAAAETEGVTDDGATVTPLTVHPVASPSAEQTPPPPVNDDEADRA